MPFRILATEADISFSQTYCRQVMKLPFQRGWERYEVYQAHGQDLEFKARFDTYDEAKTYVQSCS